MKIRHGFVSNSSSSSFICSVCKEDYSGWDAGLSEAEMYECENNHIFCESHLVNSEIDTKDNYEISPEGCPICQFKNIDEKFYLE